MAAASTPLHEVFCEPKGEESLCVTIPSDNLCAGCSAYMYLLEKRYAVGLRVFRAGGRVRDLQSLTPAQIKMWVQWRYDRERFRAIGVDGGENGELGQGWRKKKVVEKGRDFYREAGKGWMSERYGPGRMLGWKEDLGFDGFLGEMGKWESHPEEKGLTLGAVVCGVGGGELRSSKEDSKEEPKEG